MEKHQRKVSPVERIFMRSPYAIVTMIARFKGNVTENELKDAVKKAQKRHQNLRVRIQEALDHSLFFTSNNVKDIPIEIVPRQSNEDWIQIFHEQCAIPFEFDQRPAIRFVLVFSPQMSELIIMCHHFLCDGLSLAYLARDILTYLGDPRGEVEVLPDPAPIDRSNLPKEIDINLLTKCFINHINKQWLKNPTYFDQEDYVSLNQTYWNNFRHHMFSVEMSESQTNAVILRCNQENVSVNTAITCAFAGAQTIILGNKVNPNVMIACSLRDRLPKPAGEAFGFFAGGVTLKYRYNLSMSFWDNSRKLNKKLKPLYTTKKIFKKPVNWLYLDQTIMESFSFKMVGSFVKSDSQSYNKILSFSKQKDAISSLLKSQKIDSLDKQLWGTAITNLTRLDFPRKYGSLELDRLIMNPGGMFPLAIVNLVVGAVTCSGKLSLLIEHEEKTLDNATVEKIKDDALKLLLEA